MSNVLPLRPHQTPPSWRARLIVVVTYWFAAVQSPRIQPEELLNLVLLLALAYWALVYHRKHWVSYYVRFHWLQILMVITLLGIGFAILYSAVQLLLSILPLFGLQSLASPYMVKLLTGTILAGTVVKFTVPFWLGFAALINKNPTLPTVSEQARHWA